MIDLVNNVSEYSNRIINMAIIQNELSDSLLFIRFDVCLVDLCSITGISLMASMVSIASHYPYLHCNNRCGHWLQFRALAINRYQLLWADW